MRDSIREVVLNFLTGVVCMTVAMVIVGVIAALGAWAWNMFLTSLTDIVLYGMLVLVTVMFVWTIYEGGRAFRQEQRFHKIDRDYKDAK